jgi:peptidyl-prolyl cis-trans isomerase-like protein 2
MSMANKGKNTNSSQFFITYRPAKHLDRKHTIFGRVVGGLDVLQKLENAPVDGSDRPVNDIIMEQAVVFVDPFEEFQKQKREKDDAEKEKAEIMRQGGTDDDKTTWTGKRIRGGQVQNDQAGGVGKYLKAAASETGKAQKVIEDDVYEEPVKKKVKTGGFGNFDGW